MKNEFILPVGISNGVVDAYENSFPFLFRTILFNTFLSGDKSFEHWKTIPLFLENSEYHKNFKSVFKTSLRTIELWKS